MTPKSYPLRFQVPVTGLIHAARKGSHRTACGEVIAGTPVFPNVPVPGDIPPSCYACARRCGWGMRAALALATGQGEDAKMEVSVLRAWHRMRRFYEADGARAYVLAGRDALHATIRLALGESLAYATAPVEDSLRRLVERLHEERRDDTNRRRYFAELLGLPCYPTEVPTWHTIDPLLTRIVREAAAVQATQTAP